MEKAKNITISNDVIINEAIGGILIQGYRWVFTVEFIDNTYAVEIN